MRRLPRLLRQVASIEVLGIGARKGNAMQLKPVMTWSAEERKARLFRVMWERVTVIGLSLHYRRSYGWRFV